MHRSSTQNQFFHKELKLSFIQIYTIMFLSLPHYLILIMPAKNTKISLLRMTEHMISFLLHKKSFANMRFCHK